MKRELKFRAWCRDGEWEEDGEKMKFVMISSDNLCFSSGEPLRDLLKDIDDDIYFMQYTGLVDKTGKEVYEGDIIKLGDVVCCITWDDGAFQMVTNKQQGKSCAVQDRVKRFEIIGNIYQNPELVEEEQK